MANTVISSQTYDIPASQERVFTWLSDLRNLESAMPQGKISNWKATESDCSFIIKGMSTIGMEIKPGIPPQQVHMHSSRVSPIVFDLYGHIDPTDQGCRLRFEMITDMTPFVKMVAEKPLTSFFDSMTANIKAQMEAHPQS
ncbi:MAG: hypothetical protein H6585_10850 [Flavobacteriales bacterium]|nr:hypothetical protein [Flavobacteriales bacterium]MCB9448831.1 hypothetical protein [Flavobacteriales bacterium]